MRLMAVHTPREAIHPGIYTNIHTQGGYTSWYIHRYTPREAIPGIYPVTHPGRLYPGVIPVTHTGRLYPGVILPYASLYTLGRWYTSLYALPTTRFTVGLASLPHRLKPLRTRRKGGTFSRFDKKEGEVYGQFYIFWQERPEQAV